MIVSAILASSQPSRAQDPAADSVDSRLELPSGERWTIGLGWKDDWPQRWHHASVQREETSGPWKIASGQLQLPEGTWKLQDAWRLREDGLIELRRRWEWTGQETLPATTLSIRWQVPCDSSRPFLPGINYYGNPSGARIDSGRVPVIDNQDSRAFYEEHRYPMPLAAIEGESAGERFTAALHSRPSPLPQAARPDLWWSLGLQQFDGGVELALLSGPVASNGQTGIVKARKHGFLPYDNAYLDVAPGTIIEKTCFLQRNSTDRQGTGFQSAVQASIKLHRPFSLSEFPEADDIIRAKVREAGSRWHQDAQSAGFRFLSGDWDNTELVMGWAGQTEAPGYAFRVLGTIVDVDAEARQRADALLSFLSTAPMNEQGFAVRYDFARHQWSPRRDPLSQAQAMLVFADAIRLARLERGTETEAWEQFLRAACTFHSDRILAADWSPVATNEAFLVSPLMRASRLFEDQRLQAAATKAAEHYLVRHADMTEPYWGGTLDARCEDKEAAWAALQAFLEMYEQTQEQKYLEAARHACDVVLSYVYVWDVPLPPGRLADHGLKTRGWSSVSVQNHHLDVFGVLIAPAVYRLGHLTGDMHLERIAKLMFVSCGQLIDARGGQGEQLQQTNYSQFGEVTSVDGLRGGYAERWTVFWMTAHFLTAAAQFEEMGVPITRPGGLSRF